MHATPRCWRTSFHSSRASCRKCDDSWRSVKPKMNSGQRNRFKSSAMLFVHWACDDPPTESTPTSRVFERASHLATSSQMLLEKYEYEWMTKGEHSCDWAELVT